MAAPGIKVQIDAAIQQFRWNEAGYRELLNGPILRNLVRRAIRVESQAKRNASEPPRSGPGSGSAPGRGPAVRTGRLRGSITWRPGKDAVSPFVDIGTAVFYAPFVELGTSRMAARPFLRPALQAARTD